MKKSHTPSKKKASRNKRQITIRLESNTIRYFKKLAGESGMAYQNLINLYLRDCIEHKRKPIFKWAV